MITKELRSYEVSLWTLQDEFITVLKWSDVEQDGRIEKPEMKLGTDGMQSLSFSIPMYLYKEVYDDEHAHVLYMERKENPIWYNTRNGNLMQGLRKIKVILNKENTDLTGSNWYKLFQNIYLPKDYNGNVDLFDRVLVPASAFTAAGYEFTGNYGTIYSGCKTKDNYDIIYTPITVNGEVKSASYMNTYIANLTGTSIAQLLADDASKENLILSIFPVDSVTHYEKWCTRLHNLQEEWDQIRAQYKLLNTTNNPANLSLDHPYYYYYLEYMRPRSVFEFPITKITETHEQDQLICNVECEGLPFHELGKIGYKISLSSDLFLLNKKEWDEWKANPNDPTEVRHWTKRDGTICTTEPKQNLQYWCEQCGLAPLPQSTALIDSTKWYYDVQMNWDSFSIARSSNIIYENEYVAAWTNDLTPKTLQGQQEKWRPVQAEGSNIYNITQTIAQTFQVYCKYEYGYDANYHITSRKVIFYNNFIDENNMGSFSYPHSSKSMKREIDSSNITTKMYVRPQDNNQVVSGQINIADCSANKTKEDYLLNFDYLHTIGAVTDEQMDEVTSFEQQVRILNNVLETLSAQIEAKDKTIVELKASQKITDVSRTLDSERLDYNSALYKKLGADQGYITRGCANPYSTYIKQDTNGRYYIDLAPEEKGIDTSHFMIFRVFNSAKFAFKNQIQTYTLENDEYDFPNKVILPANFSLSFTTDSLYSTVDTDNNWTISSLSGDTASSIQSNSTLVYLIYKYKPQLYYDAINQVWLEKQKLDEAEYQSLTTQLEAAEAAKATLTTTYNSQLYTKQRLIQKFETMMGPALREGYWQPDSYNDYGDIHTNTLASSLTYTNALAQDTGNNAVFGWDTELFDDEDKLYFEEGVLKEKVYYPCIQLNSAMIAQISTWLNNNQLISFVFNNNYYKSFSPTDTAADIQNLSVFSLGGGMHLGFIKSTSSATIIPVLVLTGAEDMTDEQISFMMTANPRLGVTSITTVNNKEVLNVDTGNLGTISSSSFIIPISYQMVYPRIKISSNDLHSTSIVLKYNNTLLANYQDYTTLMRVSNRIDDSDGLEKGYLEYFITIKNPAVFFKAGNFTSNFDIVYTLSNAATAIYLDATKIMEDNSKPKVSYEIEVNALNVDYLATLYQRLGQIIHINDVELKFEEVFGYISELVLDLDAPQNDKITVKNYTTKFEDIFSTIVAQTESMKRNEILMAGIAAGNVPINEETFETTINNNISILSTFIDSQLDSSIVIRDKLAELFEEAGTILSNANDSLASVRNLNLKNADILNGFIEKISANLTPNIAYSQTQPFNYKVGDIWNQVDANGNIIGRYIATSNSEDTASGYTRTFDGSLAAIKGASLNVDAVAGTVEILAENRIDMKSGGNIYIAANENVDIVGNKAVNIGGTQINIGSATANGATGGINLVASVYNAIDTTANVSKVLISPTHIEMGAAELTMTAASTINMIASSGTAANTSTIQLNANTGVWIGSGKSISLYSGTGTTGANVNITPIQIIMGVSNDSSASVFDLTPAYLLMGVGTTSADFSSANVALAAADSITGMKLTKDSFGISVGTSNRTVMLMNNDGFTIGAGATPLTSGSYVTISGEGVKLGSLADLYVNMNNFKLQTDILSGDVVATTRFAIGTNLNNIDATTIDTISSDNTNAPFVGLVYNKTGLFVSGYIYASGGSFSGDVSASTFIATCTNGKLKATGTTLGFYDTSDNAVMTLSGTTMTVAGNFNLSSDNLTIKSNPSTGENYFYVGDSGNNPSKYIKYTENGTLEVKGSITATNFTLGSDGHALGISDVSGLQTALENASSSGWSINGLSNTRWGTGTQATYDSKPEYVLLSSTTGLMLGADTEIVIPRFTPNGTDAADNTNTLLKINNSGINFDVYANTSAIEASSYIHMGTDGIAVKGNRISINGKDVWARDDIIILKRPEAVGYETQAQVEARMTGVHDWVLIKPYYDAEINYEVASGQADWYLSSTSSQSRLLAQVNGTQLAFGATASWYQYDLTFKVRYEPATTTGDTNYTWEITCSAGANSVTFASSGEINYVKETLTGSTKTVHATTGHVATNLCAEGAQLKLTIKNIQGDIQTFFADVELVASCDATTSRVPCTVYYYPEIPQQQNNE